MFSFHIFIFLYLIIFSSILFPLFKQSEPPNFGCTLLSEKELEDMGLTSLSALREAMREVELQRRQGLNAKREFVLLQNKLNVLNEAFLRGAPVRQVLHAVSMICLDRVTGNRERLTAKAFTEDLIKAGVQLPGLHPTATCSGPTATVNRPAAEIPVNDREAGMSLPVYTPPPFSYQPPQQQQQQQQRQNAQQPEQNAQQQQQQPIMAVHPLQLALNRPPPPVGPEHRIPAGAGTAWGVMTPRDAIGENPTLTQRFCITRTPDGNVSVRRDPIAIAPGNINSIACCCRCCFKILQLRL